ncbi:hypothetical protein Q0Z83_050200 [Actinoplanes sichuanensis]|uniref:DUF4132 domain-containing protein n=1 Tax=Actinoplanes sichuanensis TaxID=512349 RepID=A0ABW4APV8_9ACTN|nr:DUF4132 domain-containing protein [Actinoplanes sichuanensis]BEL06829.1 hypothetical protein Q0Z83_050200 [Actinoplanes sichuanensis]
MGVVKRNRFVRRGSVDVPPFVIDTSGGASAARRSAADRAALLAVLDDQGTSAEITAAGRAWLDDEADAPPLGAAAEVTALSPRVQHPEKPEEVLTPFADVWLGRRGLVFAARAAIEHALLAGHERERPDPYRHGPIHLTETPMTQGGFRGPVRAILLRVRAAVAAATDREYAEMLAAVRPYRDRGWTARVATSVLLPSESDWVEQDIARADGSQAAELLLLAAGTKAQAEALAPFVVDWWHIPVLPFAATVADGVGPDAAGALLTWFDIPYMRAEIQQRILSVVAELDGDAAFAALLDRLDRRYVQAAVLDAAARFPARAMRLFAEADTPLLRAHVPAHLDLVDEVRPRLTPAAAERVRELADAAAAVTYAPAEAVPPVLASPPWQHRVKAAKPVVITGLSCDDPATVCWRPGERDRWLNTPGNWEAPWISWERAAEVVASGHNEGFASMVFTAGADDLARPLLSWRASRPQFYDIWLRVAAARFELAALGLLQDAAGRSPALTDVLLPFSSPAIAVFMADRYTRMKSARPAAHSWLRRHAVSAARALVPAALDKAGPARRQAETVLLALPADTVHAAASGYGPEAAAAIAALLARDPLTQLPARLPANPAWAVPAILPPVRLRDGSGALPPSAVDALITMLAITKMDEPYAGIALVADVCEPGDLARFAWGLLEAWQLAGADPKQSWVLDALALLGDDTTVRQLTPLILAWPGEGGHTKAVAGVRALATIGSDTALMRLYGISQRAKFKGLKTAAEEKIIEVADGLGLTAEQLADRLVPDFGLAADGSLTLDYGSRQFTVGFDEQLKPYVSETDGKRLKALPKPSGPIAEEAQKRFSALKKDVRTVAADQVRRLEQAMVTGRRWTPDEFARYFAGHPLLWHIVRRLVWTVSNGDSFRVGEDRGYADVADEPYTLPDDVTVGVAHPLDLAAGWSEVFDDYEILQPFPQLGREVYTETDLKDLVGAEVPTTRLLGLERRGWRRDTPEDAGVQNRIERTIAGRTVIVELDPGIPVGIPDELGDQTLTEIQVSTTSGRQPFTALGPVAVSEVIRDLKTVVN